MMNMEVNERKKDNLVLIEVVDDNFECNKSNNK